MGRGIDRRSRLLPHTGSPSWIRGTGGFRSDGLDECFGRRRFHYCPCPGTEDYYHIHRDFPAIDSGLVYRHTDDCHGPCEISWDGLGGSRTGVSKQGSPEPAREKGVGKGDGRSCAKHAKGLCGEKRLSPFSSRDLARSSG